MRAFGNQDRIERAARLERFAHRVDSGEAFHTERCVPFR
jgi:hypothetical protein